MISKQELRNRIHDNLKEDLHMYMKAKKEKEKQYYSNRIEASYKSLVILGV